MKRLIAIILCVLLSVGAHAVNVLVNVRDISSTPPLNRVVRITLIQPVGSVVVGPWLVSGNTIAQMTDTNGVCTFSNIVTVGQYRLEVSGNPPRSFPFSVAATTPTNGTYNVIQLMGTNVAPEMFYDSGQIDALFAQARGVIGNGLLLDNVSPNALILDP